MSSPSSGKPSTPSTGLSSPRTRTSNHSIETGELPETLGAVDLVTNNGSQPSLSSRYLDMLVKVDKTPFFRNLLAGFFTWLLLAGYIVFPGAFTSLNKAGALNELGNVGKAILTEAQKGILAIAGTCCGCAAIGIGWLWWKCQSNYVWLENDLFLPALRYSVIGLINGLVSIYTAHDGYWSVTAIVTTTVTGTCAVVMLGLYLIYKRQHKEAREEFENEERPMSEQADSHDVEASNQFEH